MDGLKKYTPKPPKQPAAPRVPAGLGRKQRPPKVTRQATRQYGPKILKRGADVVVVNDWSIPPDGFVGAHTSKSEWMIYAAIAFVKKDPPQPRRPPFIGGATWQYQSPLGGGRLERGGQVCDFLVQSNAGVEMCFRLQTEYWHVQAGHAKVQQDFYLKTHTPGVDVVDIYEQEYIADKTLRSACRVVANALAGRETPNPSLMGTSKRVRP